MTTPPQPPEERLVPVPPATQLPAFDNRIAIECEDGRFIRFLTHPLDRHYIEEPEDAYLPGMLPPAELEMRHALNDLKFALLQTASFNAIGRTLLKRRYRAAQTRLHQIITYITQHIRDSAEHRAALHRIVNAMPNDSSGRELLMQFFKATQPNR